MGAAKTAREVTLPQIEKKEDKKAVDYLRSQRDQRMGSKDYVLNSRRVLMKQIAINDKIEETERLKEFIVMEEEQLAEKGKTFDEDKESFENYVNQVRADAEKAANDVKRLNIEKNGLNDEIRLLELKIKDKENEAGKVDENIRVFTGHKDFLDEMAEFVGIAKAEEKPAASSEANPEEDTNTFITAGKQKGEFKTHFTQKTLLQSLVQMEEDNLFLINNVQEEDQNLEEVKRLKEMNIAPQLSKIDRCA